MKMINAERAAELIFELLKAKPWLVKPEIMNESDFSAEPEAIIFLQNMVENGANSYGNTSEQAQRIVSSLMHDFMGKLMHPNHPLSKKTWMVDDSKPIPDQALQVIGAEIAQSHPHKQGIH